MGGIKRSLEKFIHLAAIQGHLTQGPLPHVSPSQAAEYYGGEKLARVRLATHALAWVSIRDAESTKGVWKLVGSSDRKFKALQVPAPRATKKQRVTGGEANTTATTSDTDSRIHKAPTSDTSADRQQRAKDREAAKENASTLQARRKSKGR